MSTDNIPHFCNGRPLSMGLYRLVLDHVSNSVRTEVEQNLYASVDNILLENAGEQLYRWIKEQ